MKYFSTAEIPDYLVKTSLVVSLLSITLVTPFGLNNLFHDRYLLGTLNLLTVVLCVINSYLCFKGNYNIKLAMFGMAPLIVVPIFFAVHKLGVIGSYWAYVGVLVLYFVLPIKFAWKANVIFVLLLFPIAWNVLEITLFIRFYAILIAMSIHGYISTYIIAEQHFLLKQKANTDKLTGLYNRALLQSSLEYAIHQHNRVNIAMTLIMLDIDHFKEINDQYGHNAGDTVLMQLGQFLLKSFRGSDMIFRIGGEEIMILVHNSDQTACLEIAENIRCKIEMLTLVPEQPVTVSIGVSSLQADIDWEEWMKRCDKNLYRAKLAGRNQVVG